MIVCSKRVFLNFVTQMFPAEILLNANYYLPDTNAASKTFVNNSTGINESGQIVRHNNATTVDEAYGPYHIKKNDVLDISPYIIKVIVGTSNDDGYIDPTEQYIKHINNPDVLWAVYNFLFREQLSGNGLQIMVFDDHKTLWKYGNIICQYLSSNFGVDITYIDKAVVDICDGFTKYTGDKQRAMRVIKAASDYDILVNFNQSLSLSINFGTDHNVMTYLRGLDAENLGYLFNLLFPEAPLPPGNYTEEHVRQIICGRVMDSVAGMQRIPQAGQNLDLNNLMIHNWQTVLNEFNNDATVEEIFDEEPGADSGIF